ncbi:MAG: hypothetical protein JWM57_1902 [Phycisphaerales bacterium]|nr:hypothetical protein [Phycisphaerales bacterium]
MAESNSHKFTMVQLFVVLGMIVFAVLWLVPAGGRSIEGSNRIKCASNLRQIGLAMKMYANGETRTNSYPRTRYSQSDADHPKVFTKPNATNPFTDDGPEPNDVTAALFLTLRTQEITTDVYLCPDDQKAERMLIPNGKDIRSFSNFLSPKNLSYSMQNPYPTEAAEKAGFIWSDSMNADFAIMADKNPGAAELKTVTFANAGADQRTINSPNHELDGQNVLYADGHVDWSASAWAGVVQDNIYGHNAPRPFTAKSPTTLPEPTSPPTTPIGIVGPPADGNDSVMLPVASDSAAPQ